MRRAKVLSQFSALIWAVGRKRPPLCRGCAPATPPSKTIAHRPCLRIPAVPLQQPGCRQPNTQSDLMHDGNNKWLVKTDTVDGLVVTSLSWTALSENTRDPCLTKGTQFIRCWSEMEHKPNKVVCLPTWRNTQKLILSPKFSSATPGTRAAATTLSQRSP